MEKRREVYREEGRSKGQETEKKVGLEERREGGKGEERQSGRKKKVVCLLLDPGNQNLLLIQL